MPWKNSGTARQIKRSQPGVDAAEGKCYGIAMRRFNLLLLSISLTLLIAGCVERRFIVRAAPMGTRVVVDGEDWGPTPQSLDFVFYGTHEFILKKPGYETLRVTEEIDAPVWQYFPIDFFAEFLYPGTLVDERIYTYALTPVQTNATREDVEKAFLDRGEAAREKVDTME